MPTWKGNLRGARLVGAKLGAAERVIAEMAGAEFEDRGAQEGTAGHG